MHTNLKNAGVEKGNLACNKNIAINGLGKVKIYIIHIQRKSGANNILNYFFHYLLDQKS